ncbi:hypothetical protein PAXRUDRAFT_597205 [Paxillus rubicundulus Ve08.2h10]|uniref:Uncharacterized protein n=1 Tax=Paxillus rubicundulus Ve08.2h10 TaxID=930991 RepID=A0A0D0DLB5_9AGAM|nr:hypothetical protein PAXRUDRAFT_597205 [Paxillus rubicundulus Ve08.2h10]
MIRFRSCHCQPPRSCHDPHLRYDNGCELGVYALNRGCQLPVSQFMLQGTRQERC